MSKDIYNTINNTKSLQKISDILTNQNGKVGLFGVSGGLAYIVSAIKERLNKTAVIITYSEKRAKTLWDDFSLFYPQKTFLYPSKDILFYNAEVHSQDITRERFNTLYNLYDNNLNVVILTVGSLFDKLMPKELFFDNVVTIKDKMTIDPEKLIQTLIYLGYEPTVKIEGAGQFSHHGGILDVFSPSAKNPYRIEFFDIEIDSIRSFDIVTQRSFENLSEFKIFPAKELFLTEDLIVSATKQICADLEKITSNLAIDTDNKFLIKETVNAFIEKLSEHKTAPNIGSYISYFYEDAVNILDYFNDSFVVFDDFERVKSQSELINFEFCESFKARIEKGLMLSNQQKMVFSFEDILHKMDPFKSLYTSILKKEYNGVKDYFEIATKEHNFYNNKFNLLLDEIDEYIKKQYTIVILAGSEIRAKRLYTEFFNMEIPVNLGSSIDDYKALYNGIFICPGSCSKGYIIDEIKFMVVSDKEVFMEHKHKKVKKHGKKGIKIEHFEDLKPGDYVVHDVHGIGLFKGIEQVASDNAKKDYLKIEYDKGSILFVATTNLDMLEKYSLAEGRNVKLNKLGGIDFNKTKTKVKTAVTELAAELVNLYANRMEEKGFVFAPDSPWQKEFEDAFIYEETDDQLSAIEEVKRDMETDKIMDRLVCGDVGSGKTEVAIRSAFKAVENGKQVAVLVPTTILCQQHYVTFKNRMENYPVTVGVLSRFQTKKQMNETIKKLEKGLVDIVIGTHRILSKDVVFKNLGLLVVDEEQRFGVSHKERLKEMSKKVDVLTLSATPIPRTLHMSLTGIRDMSLITELPNERRPVQTYVMEYNPVYVKDAINRELGRGGQVYYLHNRVASIDRVATELQKEITDGIVSFAHGQMSERELENIMMNFIDGKIDVLVCTTIIETGLDIPNVNTIIINDADKMGLSQLYQLRGRVGRSNRIGYCYLMYQKNRILQEIAEKRLQTIKEFTEFGSGFKIAMRDLEIRGAGSLLGKEQSGHMELIGYELYCRLLKEAVLEIQGKKPQEKLDTQVDINISAYIPKTYIEDEITRLDVYKSISSISDMNDYREVLDEITDRFSDVPKEVINLLDAAYIKALSNKLGISSITTKGYSYVFTVQRGENIDITKFQELFTKYKGKLLFTAGEKPYFTFKEDDIKVVLPKIKDILETLLGV